MSRKETFKLASTHPEVIAIGLEVTLDPGRRRHYSPLVLMLADAAVQEIVRMIAVETPRPLATGIQSGGNESPRE